MFINYYHIIYNRAVERDIHTFLHIIGKPTQNMIRDTADYHIYIYYTRYIRTLAYTNLHVRLQFNNIQIECKLVLVIEMESYAVRTACIVCCPILHIDKFTCISSLSGMLSSATAVNDCICI